jgi:hypothetical protein
VKHRPQGLAFFALLLFFSFQVISAHAEAPTSSPQAKFSEQREGTLDMVILLDKSLSVAPFFDKVKAFAAGNLIGSILVPGDRLIVEAVYGKTDRLITATIASEEDKASAIRQIRTLKANGRFTDLGAALDVAKRDLDELGRPERPKYVVLLTDERQEAPRGSPYQATNYKLKHPSLQYIKKVDLGRFRAITVGLQVGTKVSETTPVVMQLLMDPPAPTGGAKSAAGAAAGGAGSGAAGNAAPEGGVTRSERVVPAWLLYGAAMLLALALIGVGVALVVAGRRKEGTSEQETAEQPQ